MQGNQLVVCALAISSYVQDTAFSSTLQTASATPNDGSSQPTVAVDCGGQDSALQCTAAVLSGMAATAVANPQLAAAGGFLVSQPEIGVPVLAGIGLGVYCACALGTSGQLADSVMGWFVSGAPIPPRFALWPRLRQGDGQAAGRRSGWAARATGLVGDGEGADRG